MMSKAGEPRRVNSHTIKKLLSFFTMTVDTKTNDDIFVPSLVTGNRVLVRVFIAFR